MKVALCYFKEYRDWYIYRNDTFWKLKNAESIEMMNLLNTRLMKVALHYI